MVSPEIKIIKSFNSSNAGLAVLKQELKDTNLLKILDKDCPKHSGFKSSEILTLCIFKNILNISTFTETSEIFEELPELTLKLSRTTISRNLTKIGNMKNYNFYLSKFVEDIIKKYKINPK